MDQVIDEINRRLLVELQLDGTLSVDALAERVNLSRNACWRRIKQMEQSGVIKARVALVDPDSVGLGLSAFVMVKTNQHDPQWLNEFHKAVAVLPEIVGAHRMSGDLDYVLRVRLGSVKDYDNFYQRLIKRIPIADISASFVMDEIKDTTVLPL